MGEKLCSPEGGVLGRGARSWRGEEGAAAAGPLRGGEERGAFFTTARPPPGAPSRISIAVRISKAAPGLFRSGNLILRGVYFSTLENSQCRTERGRTQPADAASGRRGLWGAGRTHTLLQIHPHTRHTHCPPR